MYLLYLIMAAVALFSYITVNWIFLKILMIAKVKGLVDNPNARKLQKYPIPVLGGLAVFFGLLMGMLLFVSLCRIFLPTYVFSSLVTLFPVFLCSSILLYTGALDDILGLTPKARILIEIVVMLGMIYGTGMCVDSLQGLWGVSSFCWWIAVPFTVFAGVGIINAYNMVDGVNGLSSGLCITCSFFLTVVFWKRFDYVDCALALSFGMSLVPFFLHNVFGKRSKMFIGDAGTMVMGLLVSWFMIRLLSSNVIESDSSMCLGAMMLAIASVPVFDTIRVMFGRILRGESPFHADKTHLHHAFIAVGISHSVTTLSEIMINFSVVALWYVSYKCGLSKDLQMYCTILIALVLVWGTYYLLNFLGKDADRWLSSLAKSTHLGHTDWWLNFQEYLDRGAYEDYLLILREKYHKRIEDMNQKEKDIATIVNYLQGKKNVKVADVLQHAMLEELYVYELLEELEVDGVILNIKTDEKKRMKVIRISKDIGQRI